MEEFFHLDELMPIKATNVQKFLFEVQIADEKILIVIPMRFDFLQFVDQTQRQQQRTPLVIDAIFFGLKKKSKSIDFDF